MEPFKLTKKTWGRRRFIRTSLNSPIELWEEEALKLRETILTTTNLQIIGPKAIIEINGKSAGILLEVIGIPSDELETVDWESVVSLIYQFPEDVFEADFIKLIQVAGEIKQKIPHKTLGLFHIVIDGHKIGLHFFMQKDYSQR